ncbi:50S ribosomal protein L29 [Entomospira entomophila]|uniref:Large ribosomal subunit protein uL29 n=1 Tax=Entomospira entomophila TaxID=2719988 RepID=A0A968KTF1_9SPIO|nr:50S ribosomal protein L29 [Entomospira entomophilus]NIZ40246.1 50S ribosomal protein L29 [Entomospira entomophilus]WDI35805.1 50S ribosomal protein L29 [Entomospira entomophilus]
MAKDKNALSAKSLSALTLSEKEKKRDELLAELRRYRFTSVMGSVENKMQKRNLRKGIARLNTMIHEHKLGKRT